MRIILWDHITCSIWLVPLSRLPYHFNISNYALIVTNQKSCVKCKWYAELEVSSAPLIPKQKTIKDPLYCQQRKREEKRWSGTTWYRLQLTPISYFRFVPDSKKKKGMMIFSLSLNRYAGNSLQQQIVIFCGRNLVFCHFGQCFHRQLEGKTRLREYAE